MKEPASTVRFGFNLGASSHGDITRAADHAPLSALQLAFVVAANEWQDAHPAESKLHVDNCAFVEAAAYVEQEWALIGRCENKYGLAALAAFGRLLHTVQDFYAHSNWIDLHMARAIPVWDWKTESLPPGISSGSWAMGEPKKCPPCGCLSHEEMNKESPTSTKGKFVVPGGPNIGKNLYTLALKAATAATDAQFAALRSLPPPAKERVLRGTSDEVRPTRSRADLLDQLLAATRQMKG